jgi:large subunit ribosomal protein L5
MTPRLKKQYEEQIAEKLMKQFGINNPMAMPTLAKIVLNVGMGNQLEGTKLNPKAREQVVSDLTLISGQRPIVKKAKKSVANFKLRAGYEVGAMVTLRSDRMWEFLDRLITVAIPRIKDFRGLKDKLDGHGNYSFGINEQGIFPEVDMTSAQYTHGMNINLIFQNSSDEMTRSALSELGFPFVKPDQRN